MNDFEEHTQADDRTEPLGRKRNLVWRMIQIPLQIVFVVLFRYRCQGTENYPEDSGALLLINHQSYLDPLLVGLPLTRPVSFLARDSLFRVPIVGWILRNTFVMPINRDAAGTESIRKAIVRTEQGYLVGIFPEGTRSRSNKIGTLKPGFIALARRIKTPIIPVGIAGAHIAMPKGKLPRLARVSVSVGRPIDAQKLAELTIKGRESELLEYIRQELQIANDSAQQMLPFKSR